MRMEDRLSAQSSVLELSMIRNAWHKRKLSELALLRSHNCELSWRNSLSRNPVDRSLRPVRRVARKLLATMQIRSCSRAETVSWAKQYTMSRLVALIWLNKMRTQTQWTLRRRARCSRVFKTSKRSLVRILTSSWRTLTGITSLGAAIRASTTMERKWGRSRISIRTARSEHAS